MIDGHPVRARAGIPSAHSPAGDGARPRLLLPLRLGAHPRRRAAFSLFRRRRPQVGSHLLASMASSSSSFRPYMELPEHDLAASASLPAQQRFYPESGIQVCSSIPDLEIEVGMSTAPAAGAHMNLQASVEQVFSEGFFQQSLMEELLQLPPMRPSSMSSSPLPSFSVGSPAVDGPMSLVRTTAMSSSATPSPRELAMPPPLFRPRQPYPVPFSRHGGHGHGTHVHFPSAEADDAAMAQAMLVVLSSPTSPSALPTPSTAPIPGNHRAFRSPCRGTAFRAYNNAALAPMSPRRPSSGAPGQRMMKMVISILRRMRTLNYNQQHGATSSAPPRGQEEEAAAYAPPAPAPASSQLHHMMSERRRRERLNESFEALRGLLPPGSKQDKVTVLAYTLEYMNNLVAQVSELEAKNRTLEAAASQMIHRRRINGASPEQPLLHQAAAAGTSGGGCQEIRAQVEVTTTTAGAGAPSTSTSSPPHDGRRPRQQEQEVTIRASVPGLGLSELVVRVLELLKETAPQSAVIAVDGAIQPATSHAAAGDPRASLTLRATGAQLDEASLREAVAKSVECPAAVAPRSPDHRETS